MFLSILSLLVSATESASGDNTNVTDYSELNLKTELRLTFATYVLLGAIVTVYYAAKTCSRT